MAACTFSTERHVRLSELHFKCKTEQFRCQKWSKRAILCKIRPLTSVKVNTNIERRIQLFGHNSAHFHFFSFSFFSSSHSSASTTIANCLIHTRKLCKFSGDVPFASLVSIQATSDVSKDKTAITIRADDSPTITITINSL